MAIYEAMVRLAHFLATLLPPCPLHEYLGLPCPSCGTTRGVLLLLEGRVGDAFLMNPLVLGGGSVFGAYLVFGWIRYFRTGHFPEPRWTPARRRWLRWSTASALVLNWAWLIWRGV